MQQLKAIKNTVSNSFFIIVWSSNFVEINVLTIYDLQNYLKPMKLFERSFKIDTYRVTGTAYVYTRERSREICSYNNATHSTTMETTCVGHVAAVSAESLFYCTSRLSHPIYTYMRTHMLYLYDIHYTDIHILLLVYIYMYYIPCTMNALVRLPSVHPTPRKRAFVILRRVL